MFRDGTTVNNRTNLYFAFQIYGWNPIFYDDPNELPRDMPKYLKDHIKNITNPDEV